MILKRIFIVALFSIVFYSCNTMEKDHIANLTHSTSIEVPSQNELKSQKIEIINKCFNDYSVNAFQAYNDYITTFGNDPKDFKYDKIIDFSIIDDYHVKSLEILDSAIIMSVLKDLNPLIRSYKINARAFAVTINSCKSYYTKKEFKKDAYQQGDVLHKLTLEIYDKFNKSDSLLRVKSDKISKTLEREYLNALKKEGHQAKYLSLLGKKEAEKLNLIVSSKKYDELNVDELKHLKDAMATIYGKLAILNDTDAQQFDKKMSSYYADLGLFVKAVDELYERKKEKNKFSKKEIKKLAENEIVARSVEGSPNKVIFHYEELIKSFNKNVGS